MTAPRTVRAPITTPATAQVFTTVLTHGPISRQDVARLTGLSSAAVTKAARPFIDAGYLRELDPVLRATGAGRPTVPLGVCADREFFLGVKVTADELIGVVTDLRARTRHSLHRPLGGRSVGEVVRALSWLADELLATRPDDRARAHCLGVAVSGDVDRATGSVRYSPFLGWRDVPLGELLGEATGLTVTVENDVKSLAVAEYLFGHGVGSDDLALVTVGAGIGCALIVGGALVAGARGVAGEIGHVPVRPDGPPCHCGGVGCVEAIASTQAIVDAARLATGDRALTLPDAVRLARAGDDRVRPLFERAGHAIGQGLAAVANLVGPERIVVSGEGVAAYDLFEEAIRTTFARQAFGAADCPLILSPLPFEEWARGAAAVAIQDLVTHRTAAPTR
ncbi:ROK family protein [Streptomyces sp. B6B3]|uniref:ROK family protein n=1 Tax=Streptomyces sp. B6B3 TaxID=3153570 RepID=UPI00325E8455